MAAPSQKQTLKPAAHGRFQCHSRRSARDLRPMDWNSGPPSRWGDWEIGHGSSLSCPAAGFFSGFDLGSDCSSRSSTSTKIDFAATAKPAPSIPADPVGISAGIEESGGAVERLMGLKLGKRTYFENPSFSSPPIDSSVKTKRLRAPQHSEQISRCQVEGCNLDLASARDYHRKHRVCESHSKCPEVVVQGRDCRFCQQCSRFHHISEFDQKKRSCRRRLSDHNARRRKPSPSTKLLPSSCYDDRLQMDAFQGQSRLLMGDAGAFDINLMPAKGSSARPISERVFDGKQQHFPVNGFRPLHNFPQLLPFKTNAIAHNQALEGNSTRICESSNLDGAPHLRSALSLLSNDHCGPPMDPFAQLNHANGVAELPLTLRNSGSWQMGQPSLPNEEEEEPWARPTAKSCTRGFFIP